MGVGGTMLSLTRQLVCEVVNLFYSNDNIVSFEETDNRSRSCRYISSKTKSLISPSSPFWTGPDVSLFRRHRQTPHHPPPPRKKISVREISEKINHSLVDGLHKLFFYMFFLPTNRLATRGGGHLPGQTTVYRSQE